MKLTLLGAPGAGKGTQAARLSEELRIPAVGTGGLIRGAIQGETALGKQAAGHVAAGRLVPDQLVVNLLRERLSAGDCVDGYILDGFPRNLSQARTLEDMGILIDHAVNLCVQEETILERLGGRRICQECGQSYHMNGKPPKRESLCDHCGGTLAARQDDAPDTVVRRLQVYRESTEPLIRHYGQKGILSLVNGGCSADRITQAILNVIRSSVYQL